MRTASPIVRFCVCAWILTLFINAPAAQQAATGAATLPSVQEARAWLAKELRYLSLDSKLGDAELDRLAELHVQSQNTAEKDKAIAAYKEMWSKIISLYGPTGGRPEMIDRSLQAMATRLVNSPAPTGEPWPQKSTPLGELGKFVKRGRGPVPMILIPPIGFDESVYETFMTRNAERYTMYAVTPAGFGGTAPPPRPERLDLEKLTYWSGFEQGVMKLIAKEKLNKPVIAGMVAGAYAAAHLALLHPEKFRAVVLLNGMLVSPMNSPADPTKQAAMEERRRLAPVRFNFGLTLPLSGVGTPRRSSPESVENFFEDRQCANDPVQRADEYAQ